jgi:hypothetical protein
MVGIAALLLLVAQAAEAPAAQPAPEIVFSRKTEADGPVLQVVFGERAVIRLDDRNLPVLMKTQKGQLSDAHPVGKVAAEFATPGPDEIAVALDGSAEIKKTVMKVWNGGSKPVRYDAIVLVLRAGKLAPRPVPGCAIPAKSARTQSWPAPIVAVALTKFAAAPSGDAVCK